MTATDSDYAWAAGVISCFGIMHISTDPKPVMRLIIKSVKHPDMVRRMAKIVRQAVAHKKTGDEVIITHVQLDKFWAHIAPYVTPARVAEYNSVRAEVMVRRQAYEDKIEYQKERALAPISTPDTIRKRNEALYHNQDPAVEVIRDDNFVQAEMAVAYDLEQAKRQREREDKWPRREKAS